MSLSHRFGRFEVRPAERRVLDDGEPVVLGARAFDLLMALIANRDRVVSKDELLTLVWPGVVVEENNLTVQVSTLRKLLGAGVIGTVPGRGYRFTAQLQDAETSAPAGPPPASAGAGGPPHNLPAERSKFIGRGREIDAVRRLLREHRLVTLTGIGGCGKTRLALQVCALELARHPDGVFFVDLAPVSDTGIVAQTVAAACGFSLGDAPDAIAGSALQRLVNALAHRRCLLLLDNCEHLVDVVADLADRILPGCPEVALLATSREALGVEGEQIVPVPPLAVPDPASPAEVTEAMQLFVERARAVEPSFELDARTRALVAEICRRLDGIPLAIEFAAARAAHLSPAQIAERLDDRFRLLTGGRRRIQRQQTLGAALDWSHDLLDPREQVAFRRLAAFAGDFSLSSAEGVCGGDPIDRAAVLDLLGSLVAKSLVTIVHDQGGEARYRLLETVRMYAADKLAAAGESSAVRTRHRDWYLGWLESVPLERLTFDTTCLAAISTEIDNLRAAADWSLSDDRPDLMARQATRMFGHSFMSGSFRETQRLLTTALQRPDRLSIDERAACEATLGFLAILATEPRRALEHATRAIELAAAPTSPPLAMGHLVGGFVAAAAASYDGADPQLADDARRHADRAVAIARANLPGEWLAFVQSFYAKTEIQLGDLDAALRWYEAVVQACDEGRVARSGFAFPDALAGVASTGHLLGLGDEALAAGLRFLALPRSQTAGFGWMAGIAAEVTPALCAGGREDLVDRELRLAAPAMRRAGMPLLPNQFLIVAAAVEHLRGRPERAGRLLGAARSLGGADKLALPFRTPASLALYRHYLPLVRTALGAEAAGKAREEGRAMTLDQAFGYALQGLGKADR